MRSKKCFIVGVTLAACFFGLHTTLWGQELKDPNEEIKLLQEKIKQLENVIETQQNTISQLNQELDKQTKEIKRLEMLCSKAGIDISPVKDTEPSKVSSRNMIEVSLKQLYYFYEAPMTDVEKEKRYKEKYKGKWVQWTGKVKSIDKVFDHYNMVFIYDYPDKAKANALDELVVEVTVAFDKMLNQKILSFKEDYIVTYEGRLPDSYKGLAGLRIPTGPSPSPVPRKDRVIKGAGHLSLTDGRIVSP